MAYVPDWERLSDALKRVIAAGVSEDEAKLDISRAIADGKIRVRVTIAEGSADISGTLAGANVKPPDHLTADDFDWATSQPIKPWLTGPREWKSDERHLFIWRPRPISQIEVHTADVIRVLCDTQTAAIVKNKEPKRGRPANYNWTGVKTRLVAYVSQHGPVQTLNELLQKCSDFASELHPCKTTPSDKTIREAIKTHSLDIAARFAPGKSPGK